MAAPLAVIILTYNEELNLPATLDSVCGWAAQVFVVDSFSTDRTLELAKSYGVEVHQHPFEDWATQRNWALDNLPIRVPWVLFLDADERVTSSLAEEIGRILPRTPPEVVAYYIDRHFFFMGRWLKHGGYSPNWVLRLVRPERTRVIPAGDREYFQVSGMARYLKGHLIHDDLRGLDFWITKHIRISSMAARRFVSPVAHRISGPTGELEGHWRIWLRQNAVERLPLLMQPFAMFFYRWVLRLGFLDGTQGFVYYFLHDLWYPLLVSAKVMELRRRQEESAQPAAIPKANS